MDRYVERSLWRNWKLVLVVNLKKIEIERGKKNRIEILWIEGLEGFFFFLGFSCSKEEVKSYKREIIMVGKDYN